MKNGNCRLFQRQWRLWWFDRTRGARWQSKAKKAFEREDFVEAFRLWSRVAATGSREAQFRLGQLYVEGKGVIANAPDAMAWYRRAAEQGHAEAQYQLSLLYQFGRADFGPMTIGEWYRVASVEDKNAADSILDILSPHGLTVERDEAEALRWTLAAAEQGLPAAQANAAIFYSRGGPCEVDYDEARNWFELAARAGNGEGEFGLGVLYANGYGVAADHAAAAEHFRKAAANNHDGAQLALGLMYLAGTGVARDPARRRPVRKRRSRNARLLQSRAAHWRGDGIRKTLLPRRAASGEPRATAIRKRC